MHMTSRKIPPRSDVAVEHKWDLTPLFESESAWEELFRQLQMQIPDYRRYENRMHESAALFLEAIEFHLSIMRRLDRLYTYAHLKSDEDKSDQANLGLYQRAVDLHTRAAERASFLVPEIQSIPTATIEAFTERESVAAYRFFLEKVLRRKPHTLDLGQEKLLAMSREIAQAPSHVFGQLDNTDLQFGIIIDDQGNEVELSHGNFLTFLSHPSRDLRRRAFRRYYAVYDGHKNTLAATLGASVKKDFFYARARRFDSCREAALFGDDVPGDVYDNLIGTVRDNLAPLFKYLDFRKKRLQLPELHFYDTYVPIVADVEFRMPYEEAVRVCLEALAPLGDEYTRILENGLLGGWVDRYENKGKRSGAYSSGCYDSPPYILLNYDAARLNSLYTLVHEAGHSMHSYYARNHQPYVNHQYTIFVAEVASTFNEDLLSRYLLDYYDSDPRMKAYIINREIDNLRGTLFRQTMFAEFEQIIHRRVETHQPLTLEDMTTAYRDLLETYFGETLVIDPELTLEFLRIPHFYAAFYVYKYATGVSAALALAQDVVDSGESGARAYIDFLKLGGSRFPLDELLQAGVDMRSPQPVARAVRRFDRLVDQLIQTLT
jgi:oligoendopeptidase F